MRHLRPRKGLGQCFLTHEPTADALVAALGAGPGDTVLEIGPGKGILTRRLLQTGARVIAVELDERLAAGLALSLGANPGFELICADFMSYDFSSQHGLKVMGNLPYNLASPILFRLLDFIGTWTSAVVTVQREFAQRLLARPGEKAYGVPTVLFERLTRRERLFNIEPGRFKPRPRVISTGLRITPREQPLFEVRDEAWFRRVVKACFGQRRKTLLNNLIAGFGLDRQQAETVLAACGIAPNLRAEDLAAELFFRLSEAL